MAARIDNIKRHDLILEVINSIKFKDITINVYFAGKGSLVGNLKNFVKKNNLQKFVFFNGNLDEQKLKKWFSNLHLYVHATSGEAMSTAILQSFSMEIPTIASNVRGVKEMFLKVNQKKLIFKNDKKSLSSKIKYFFRKSNIFK